MRQPFRSIFSSLFVVFLLAACSPSSVTLPASDSRIITNYRILILILLFFPVSALLEFFHKTFIALLGRIASIGIGGAILTAPWFIHVIGGRLLKIFDI